MSTRSGPVIDSGMSRLFTWANNVLLQLCISLKSGKFGFESIPVPLVESMY